MIEDKFWQKTLAIATIVHLTQSALMFVYDITANSFCSLGMIVIAIASLYKTLTATEKDLSEQEH